MNDNPNTAMSTMRMGWRILLAPKSLTWFLVKAVTYVVVVLVFGVSIFVMYHEMERDIHLQFQALSLVDPLVEARRLVDAGEFCEALDYLDYFMEYDHVKDNPEVKQFYEQARARRESYVFRATDVFSGIWKGKGACLESLVAATASDFLVVGDLRDLAWQGWNVYQGKDADAFTAALAGIGVILAAATYGSAGAGSPAKGVVSVLKASNKLKKISSPLRESLIVLLKEASAAKSLKPMEPVLDSLMGIAKTKGFKTRDLMEVLSRSTRVSDLRLMEEVAATYGSKTGKFLRLGGDSPVRAVKKFGQSEKLAEAADRAVQFGPNGAKLLEQVGPAKFMMYLKMTKYGVRGIRSVWQARLTMLLAWALNLLPSWAVAAIAVATGCVSFGVPARMAYRGIVRLRGRKTPTAGTNAKPNK